MKNVFSFAPAEMQQREETSSSTPDPEEMAEEEEASLKLKKYYCGSPEEPRYTSTTIGSYSENALNFGDVEEIYQAVEPEYTEPYKDANTSMETTQTESELFPTADGGYFEYASSHGTFEPQDTYRSSSRATTSTASASSSSSTYSTSPAETTADFESLSSYVSPATASSSSSFADDGSDYSYRTTASSEASVRTEDVFPKARVGFDSDFSTISQHSLEEKEEAATTMSERCSIADSECLTAESEYQGYDSDAITVTTASSSASSEAAAASMKNALRSSPGKLEVQYEKCVIFYLENHSSKDLLVALDAPPGISCSPTDMVIEGGKRKKIVAVGRKSMLIGTRDKILASYKHIGNGEDKNNSTATFKIPFNIVPAL